VSESVVRATLRVRSRFGESLWAQNDSAKEIAMDVTTDWFWEGNVVNALAHHLASKGWKIESQADTHSRERGVDLHPSKQGAILLVEAKGYPSKSYRDPRRANEQKSTNPINQAEKWYSHALLKALRLQTAHPQARLSSLFQIFPAIAPWLPCDGRNFLC
jgi:hypothetical protein